MYMDILSFEGCISIVSLMIASVLDDATSGTMNRIQNDLISQNLSLHPTLSTPENVTVLHRNSTGYEVLQRMTGTPDVQTSVDSFKIELASALSLVSGVTMVTSNIF
jgi:hypothetical protein